MKLFMVVTADEFELPVMVSDKAEAVAKLFKTDKAVIYSSICKGMIKEGKYKVITINVVEED